MAGAPELDSLKRMLQDAGFEDVDIQIKKESREVIAQWMPGSGAEDHVVAANILARKPIQRHGDIPHVTCSPQPLERREVPSLPTRPFLECRSASIPQKGD